MTEYDLSDRPHASTWWKWLPVWAAAAVAYTFALHSQVGVPLRSAIAVSVLYYATLALLMLPVSAATARLLSRPVLVAVAAHVAMAIAVVAVWQGVMVAFYRATIGPHYWTVVFERKWAFQVLYAVALYGTALSVTLTVQSWRRERERERREAELMMAARDAELLAVKAQFQPHFVLNSLNSLLALIDVDPALARTMVVRLADLMKSVFDRIDVPSVPLERELELVRAYLDVERIRLGSRLSVSLDIDDAARGVPVPPFVLQPLVENAVKHGVAPYAGPRAISIVARVLDASVRVTVTDSGPPPSPEGQPTLLSASPRPSASTGRGLHITRRRLETVYGNGYSLTLDRHEHAGTAVHLELPLQGSRVA
jgi:signal transduction histidine kinase